MTERRKVKGTANLFSGIVALGMLMISSLACSQLKSDSPNLQSNSGSGNSAASPVRGTDSSPAAAPESATDIYDVTYEDGKPFPKNPDMRPIAKKATTELAGAFLTGDFSKVYANLDPEYQKRASESDLRAAYEKLKDPSLTDAVLKELETGEPEISKLSGVTATVNINTGEKSDYVLRIEGKYNVASQPLTFRYDFVARSGKWRTKALALGNLKR